MTESDHVEYTEQAAVTDWPLRLALVGIFIALIAWALFAMRRGWRARMARQSDIPAPIDAPPEGWAAQEAPIEGMYLGTARGGEWLDRVAVHGLGVRSRAFLTWNLHEDQLSVRCEREGAPSFFIPDVLSVSRGRGIAGTVRSPDSVWIFEWMLGTERVATGFRANHTHDHERLARQWSVRVGQEGGSSE